MLNDADGLAPPLGAVPSRDPFVGQSNVLMSTTPLGVRPSYGWALAFGILALALGSAFVYPRQWTRGFLINDEAWYAEPARNLLQGRGFVTETLYPMFARQVTALPTAERFKQIGYPMVAAVAARLTGTLSDRLFVAIAIVGFGLTGFTAFLASEAAVRDRLVAGLITAATIGNPSFWSYWTAGLPESLFTACFLGFVWLLLRETMWASVVAGLLLAVSVYFKGFSLLYLPIAVGFMAFGARETRVRMTTAFVGGLVATMALATVALPSATEQLSGSGGDYAGSMLLFETRGAYPAVEGPFYDIAPINPLTFIVHHPFDYAEKVARMMSRTKAVLGELGGPASGGILFPVLVFAVLATCWDIVWRWRRGWMDTAGTFRLRLFLLGLLTINFAFFWMGNFRARYFAHLFPLMLTLAVLEAERLLPDMRGKWLHVPKPFVAVAVGYFLVYPPLIGLWDAYRDRNAYLGRMLPARWVDYRQVAKNVNDRVPAHGMVMSDMAHEISWYSGHPTVFFPGAEDQVDYLIDKFNVRALYEHPQVDRHWRVLQERFVLVDDRNGKLWIRRD